MKRLTPISGRDYESYTDDEIAAQEAAYDAIIAASFPDGIDVYLATHGTSTIAKHLPGKHDQSTHGRKGTKGKGGTIDAGPPAPATGAAVHAAVALAEGNGNAAKIGEAHNRVIEDRLGENIMDGPYGDQGSVELKKNAEIVLADALVADPAALAVIREKGQERLRPLSSSELEYAQFTYADNRPNLVPKVQDLIESRSRDKEYLEGPEVAADLTAAARRKAVSEGRDPEGLTVRVEVDTLTGLDGRPETLITITGSKYDISAIVPLDEFAAASLGGRPLQTYGAYTPVGQLGLAIRNRSVSKVVHDDPSYPGDDVVMARKYARDTTHDWASSAGDNDPRSIANQYAVADVFGLGRPNVKGRGTELETYDKARDIYAKEGAAQRAFVRAQYQATQARLREVGVGPDDTVLLYRGVGRRGVVGSNVEAGRYDSQAKQGDAVEVASNPASSWSTESTTAAAFGRNEQGGALLTAAVPSRLILGIPGSGWGCRGEDEVVVLGQLVPAALYFPAL